MLYWAAFGCKHDSAMCRELSFLFPLEKQTVVKQLIHNCGRAGWKLDFVRPILKNRILKLICLHQLMGQDPSTCLRRRKLKPEAVPTTFQHVPQPKTSTQRKHSIKITVKLEREAVSKQLINDWTILSNRFILDAISMSKRIGKYVIEIVYVCD